MNSAVRIRRKRGNLSREKIAQSAVHVITRHGLIENGLLKAIAADAGCAPSLIHYHYRDLDALIMDAVMLVVNEGRSLAENYMKQSPQGEAVLRAYMDSMFDFFLREETQALFSVLIFFARTKPEFRELSDSIFKVGVDRVGSILEIGEKGGAFPRRAPAARAAVALAIHHLILGFYMKISATHLDRQSAMLRQVTYEQSLALATAKKA